MKKTLFAAASAVLLFSCLPNDPDRVQDQDAAKVSLRDSSMMNTPPPPPPPPGVSDNVIATEAGRDSGEVLMYAEEMPEFPGGLSAFQNYLGRTIQYPQMEKEMGHQGTVYIGFVVEKDGSISDVRVMKDVPGAQGLTKEALRVIGAMPHWKPGKMNGKPVRVNITQPVKFTLR